ncbi:MAG: hypothetical protein COW55_04685 [Rhodobacteraceae bacterium CG17_big_fil_post_rev_8_21_14_2_50_65_11]|nr:MAG: hypothetical protein COW55_04685 [Rhodobacteraceae bacterium CG17_big_fil_post_rev_8_21_14_2_50_65_11]
MNGFAQDNLMTLLRIGILPILLITIYLRNRSARRWKRAQAPVNAPDTSRKPPLPPLDPDTAAEAALRAALARSIEGEGITSHRGAALTRWQLAAALADRMLAEGRHAEAEDALQGAQAAADAGRWPALLRLARVRADNGQRDTARTLLSQAAELRLTEMRTASRGDPLHFAELLAHDKPIPRDLHDPTLVHIGPLGWLVLSGRGDDSRALIDTLLAPLDRALAESAGDPTGKVDGFPRALLHDVRDRLAAARMADTGDRHLT